ncbi:MAG: MBL fold metallo-hydrolase [Candidatus Melainabacteria bacterium]|nr:MAG: MBL fold metallo-hydrolase [Candidatus Melainabacteria bacterium]
MADNLSCFCLSLSYIDFKPKTLDIINFSVQNSDLILIKTKKKKYILIDTSKLGFKGVPSQAKMILVKYLKDNNIKNLELVIVTHYDSDHAGGLIDVYENVKVKRQFF